MATRRVNPRLMAALQSASIEPLDYETPGRVVEVPVPAEHFGVAPEAPPVNEGAKPRSRFDVVREYLEANRQPMPQPTTPEVDVRAARQRDAEQNFIDAQGAVSAAFLGNRGAVDKLPNAATQETKALAEREARKRELEQWAAGRERQRMGEASLLSAAAVEPREASKPSKTSEQVDRELDIKEQDAETRRLNATKVKPAKAPKEADPSKLRKEFDALPEVKSFKDVSIGMDKIRSAAQSGTASGDMALIFAFMKILDPGSSVKEGEYASAKNAQGVPDKVLTAYNNAKDGQILSPVARAEFLKSSEQLYETERARYSAAAQRYRGMAEKQKLAPDDVAVDRGPDGPEPMVNVKRKSDGKVLPIAKSKAATLDKDKYEVMP